MGFFFPLIFIFIHSCDISLCREQELRNISFFEDSILNIHLKPHNIETTSGRVKSILCFVSTTVNVGSAPPPKLTAMVSRGTGFKGPGAVG